MKLQGDGETNEEMEGEQYPSFNKSQKVVGKVSWYNFRLSYWYAAVRSQILTCSLFVNSYLMRGRTCLAFNNEQKHIERSCGHLKTGAEMCCN